MSNPVYFIVRFIIKNLKWFIFGPLAVGIIVFYFTRNQSRSYEVNSTLYTGFGSGFSVETTGNAAMDFNAVNNANDNLISITKSRSTLERVSMKLFAQAMIYGKEFEDSKYITAKSYRNLMKIVPPEVLKMIDKSSLENTVKNLTAEMESGRENFVFGLINWYHPHYSLRSLSQIKVQRVNNSDMLDISYKTNDPAICYQTILLLNKELMDKYKELRFSETNDVVGYFERELAKAHRSLITSEDSLMIYNKENRVINYDEQTKSVASLFEKFELRHQDVLLAFNGARAALAELEIKMDGRSKMLLENTQLVSQLKKVQDLTSTITRAETFLPDSVKNQDLLKKFRAERTQSENDLRKIASSVQGLQSTKEGLGSDEIVQQWLQEMINFEKAKAELEVMREGRIELDDLFSFFSPIGATLKRKEREIGISEQSYLSLLHSLSLARLKQKSLEMSSASLRVVTAPVFPLDSQPTKRRVMILLGMVAAFIFILAYLLLIEYLDTTMRDPARAKRLTGRDVLGVIPSLKFRKKMREDELKTMRDAAARYATNVILELCEIDRVSTINVLSTGKGDGKTFFSQLLQEELKRHGYEVMYLQCGKDFDAADKRYNSAQSPADLLTTKPDKQPDFFIIEHPAVIENYVSTELLKHSGANLLVCSAVRGWREADQIALDKLSHMLTNSLHIYLNRTNKIELEGFVGLLPPYSLFRKILYKIYNLELTINFK